MVRRRSTVVFRGSLRLGLVFAAFCALWYFLCAFDLEMTLYLARASFSAANHVSYDRTNEVRVAVKRAMEEIETNLDVEGENADLKQIAMDMEALQSYVGNEGSGTKVVLACISRDDFYGLHVNRHQVEELGRRFADYRVLVVENDSSSAFRSQLQDWSASNPRVKIISKDFNLKKRPNLAFLAKVRNFYIDEFNRPEYADFSRLIVFDMDVSHRWPIEDIFASTVLPTANYGVRCFHVYNDGFVHRDVLPFRSQKFAPNFEYDKYPTSVAVSTMHHIYRLSKQWYDQGYCPRVESCFGGMASYSRDAVLKCRYDDAIDECEHMSLNKCIREQRMTLVLDTTVAIPFHYRKIVDGLLVLLLFTSCLPINLAAFSLGVARSYVYNFKGRRKQVRSFHEFLSLLYCGLVSHAWFVLFAKDRQSLSIWICFLLALGMEFLSSEFVIKKIFPSHTPIEKRQDIL